MAPPAPYPGCQPRIYPKPALEKAFSEEGRQKTDRPRAGQNYGEGGVLWCVTRLLRLAGSDLRESRYFVSEG